MNVSAHQEKKNEEKKKGKRRQEERKGENRRPILKKLCVSLLRSLRGSIAKK